MESDRNKLYIIGIFALLVIGVTISYFLTFNKSSTDNSCKPDIKQVIISGDSLEPLYRDGDKVKLDMNFEKCKGKTALLRNDIVVFKETEDSDPIIKIIMGLPKDEIEIKDEKIYINDSILRNPVGEEYKLSYAEIKLLSLYAKDYKGLIPDGAYLVMGSKLGSAGSNTLGLVGLKRLVGVVIK